MTAEIHQPNTPAKFDDHAVPAWRGFAVDTRIAAVNALLRFPSHRLRVALARTVMRWTIGDDVVIGRWLWVPELGGITVGSNVNIGHHADFDPRGGITIGSNVDIAPHVQIFSADHDPDDPGHGSRPRPTVIGDRVWIATGATVMSGATVSDGVIIGAKAVASGYLEPNGIYAGNPARLVRYRNPEAQQVVGAYRRFWL